MFYEVFVPHDVESTLIDESFGLYPSARAHPPSAQGTWYVILADGTRRERMRSLGLDPRRALRAALEPEMRLAYDPQRGADEDLLLGIDGPLCPTREIFCQYEGNGACAESMVAEMTRLADLHPGFVQLLRAHETYQHRDVVGLRIGKLTGSDVPQLLLFGAQHSQEWAGPGFLMTLANTIIDQYDVAGGPFFDALQTRAVVIVPVANPDGYAFTHATSGDRHWRRNRRPIMIADGTPCPCLPGQICVNDGGGPFCRDICGPGTTCPVATDTCVLGACYCTGVDPNRNFAFNWTNTANKCSDGTYEGPSAASDREQALLTRIFLNTPAAGDQLPGSFVTEFFVNYHSWGNYILYPDGVTNSPLPPPGDTRVPCRSRDTFNNPQGENCQPPDLQALRWLAGREEAPQVIDPSNGRGFSTDPIYRDLYTAVGDQLSDHSFSAAIRDATPIDRRSLGVSIELTSTPSAFDAECIPAVLWDGYVEDQSDLVVHILENLGILASPSAIESQVGRVWTGGRFHRLRSDDDLPDTAVYGPLRFWFDQLESNPQPAFVVAGNVPGALALFGTVGRYFETYSWKRTDGDSYRIPGRFTICQASDCQSVNTFRSVDVCSEAIVDAPHAGWQLQGQDNAPSRDDCYWFVTGRNAIFSLKQSWNAIDRPGAYPAGQQLRKISLTYSYRTGSLLSPGEVWVRARANGGAWVDLRRHPDYFHHGNDPTDGRIRTETIELPPSFENSLIEVVYEARGLTGGQDTPASFRFRLFDPVLTARDYSQ